MERLTERFDGWVMMKGCHSPCRTCNGAECAEIYPMIDRLAAYEDTMPLERAQELSQAEKGGQLMVLQDGISVRGLQEKYCMHKRLADEQLPSPNYTTGHITGFSAGIAYILGKILTHEQAEVALKKREEASNEGD